MRILIASLGSRGDVQPTFALALALRRAGHEAYVSAPPDFAAWADELQLPFRSAGESIEAMLHEHSQAMGGNPIRVLAGMRRIFVTQMPPWFDHLLEAARGADAIVWAGQMAAPSVAAKLGIPDFGIAYTAPLLPSAHHPPLLVTRHGMPRWLNRLAWVASNAALDAVLQKPFNMGRARLGLPPVSSMSRHIFTQSPFLFAADAVIAPPPPDWTRLDVTATGPWFYDDPTALDAEVEAFLAAGAPPVYVGFGSMVSADAAALTRAVLEGAGRGGRRVLLSKGWAGIGGGPLPPGAMAVHGPMPHARLFPRVAAVVHHGGAGTMATALRAGVPQVLVPHILDQFYHAHRLEKLGIAPPGLPVKRITAERLSAAIEQAVSMPEAPRKAAAERLRAGDGVRRAVDHIITRISKWPEKRAGT
jgi:UDP:flavonoid glycosyltransferase YjiC (YdhE family)